MRCLIVCLASWAAVVLGWPAAPAMADWDPGDDHKMHYPQMPDLNGWDVKCFLYGVGARLCVADDWECSQSGAVRDIHFWFSAKGDNFPAAAADNMEVYVSIYDDVPADQSDTGYSHPGDPLWSAGFSPEAITVRHWDQGDQGWLDPTHDPPLVIPNDHYDVYQANMVDIPDPLFFQEEGKTYWLGLTIFSMDPQFLHDLGWKTSEDHFKDAAVCDFGPVILDDPIFWRRLSDPITGEQLDLAFVITPEPSTLILLSMSAVGLIAYAWRRRWKTA